MSLVDIISALGDYVSMYLQSLGYLFAVFFNLPIGGVPLGYIVIVFIAISFIIGLVKFVLGGEE